MYYLVLKPVSFLPMGVLYILSDLIFFFVYRVFGYRRSVVRQNLINSFPDKPKAEIDKIEKSFFRHLGDLIVENIKFFSISEAELRKRCEITNMDLLEKLYAAGKSLIIVGGHYNNWEIAARRFKLDNPYRAIGIYAPLSNKFFDRKIGASRTKFGVEIIQKKVVGRSFVANQKDLTMTLFGADQSPTYSRTVFWMNFLHQDTAVYIGTELFAVKFNYPVVYFRLDKIKRGYYRGTYEVLNDSPKKTASGEITQQFTERLETIIEENPAFWLWSHKRWKRKRTAEELQSQPELKS